MREAMPHGRETIGGRNWQLHPLSKWRVFECALFGGQGTYKNIYKVLNLRGLKFSHVNKTHIFQCMGKMFVWEFKRCSTPNLISVCTLAQSSGGTSCGFTNIKSNWNMSRSDCKCSPLHKYWLHQSKWAFSTWITEGVHYVYPSVGEWVSQR